MAFLVLHREKDQQELWMDALQVHNMQDAYCRGLFQAGDQWW